MAKDNPFVHRDRPRAARAEPRSGPTFDDVRQQIGETWLIFISTEEVANVRKSMAQLLVSVATIIHPKE